MRELAVETLAYGVARQRVPGHRCLRLLGASASNRCPGPSPARWRVAAARRRSSEQEPGDAVAAAPQQLGSAAPVTVAPALEAQRIHHPVDRVEKSATQIASASGSSSTPAVRARSSATDIESGCA